MTANSASSRLFWKGMIRSDGFINLKIECIEDSN